MESVVKPRVERFEDLIAWQKARLLRSAIRAATSTNAFRREVDTRSQVRRAALSVMSNIAEGFERGSRADFARFLVMAKASCGEVRSILYAALDDELLDQPTFRSLLDQTEEVGRIIGGLRTAVAKQRDAQAPR
ncbi:MAG: four helix bundle protein [Dehalococcoidia bacterium]